MGHVEFARELVRDYNKHNREREGGDFRVVHESIIECPCGHRIEWDGECPEGHVSPIRTMGFI